MKKVRSEKECKTKFRNAHLLIFTTWCDVKLIQWYKEPFEEPQKENKINTIMEL